MRILVASFMLLMTVHHSIAQSRINIIPKPSMVQELEGQFAQQQDLCKPPISGSGTD